jgi:ice-binding like protein
LTGQLTLDAAGDPNAQFVFEIGSTLTTASASSVVLVNGASPCNVYWQVGSSATLGTTTAFQGNVLALTTITVNNGATVQGRLLARNGSVTLDTDVITGSLCGTSTTPPPGGTGGPGGTTGTGGGTAGTGGNAPPASGSRIPTRKGSASLKRVRTSPSSGSSSGSTSPMVCNQGFTARVRGREIKRVVFTLDGKRLANQTRSPFRVHVPATFAGTGHLKARVTFKDATRAKTLNLRYRACAAAVVAPLPAPSTFTG